MSARPKLTPRAVETIRRLVAEGERCAVLARQYRVSPSTVSAAARGRTWRHLPGAVAPYTGRRVRAALPDLRFTGIVYGKAGPVVFMPRGPRRATTPPPPTVPPTETTHA